jgi:hypothetical protein
LKHGSQEEKYELMTDVLGITPKALKSVLSTNVNAMPVVYLFGLGRAGELKKNIDIPATFNDADIVVKYGLTNDLKRRASEHETTLGKLNPNGQIGLKYHVYIDPFFLTQAEADIKEYFVGAQWHLRHPKYTELAVVPHHFLNTIVHNEFKRLGATYAGKLQDLQQQLASEKRINEQLKAQMEAQERHYQETLAVKDKYHDALMAEREVRLNEKDDIMQVYKAILLKNNSII